MAKGKPKKGINGEGTFRYKDSGKIEYRISYRDEFGSIRRKSFTGIDEDECVYKAEVFLAKEEKRQRGIDVNATIWIYKKIMLASKDIHETWEPWELLRGIKSGVFRLLS